MPNRGQEAALGIVGVLGLAFCGFQQRGSLDDAMFQRFIAA
jgi:hypothetical protein